MEFATPRGADNNLFGPNLVISFGSRTLLLLFVASSAISPPKGNIIGRVTNHILTRCVDRMLLMEVCLILNVALLCVFPISAVPLESKTPNLANLPYIDRLPSQIDLKSPSLNSGPPLYTIECLENRPGVNLATVARDCTTLFETLIFDTDEALQKRNSSRDNYIHSNGHWAPAGWAFGQCTISTRYSQFVSLDRSTLLDVAKIANQILSECVTSSRKGQGGFVSAGSNEKSFYVGLQGKLADMEVTPEDPRPPDFELSKRGLDAQVANRDLTRLQRRNLGSSRTLILLNPATPLSNSTGKLKTEVDHEVACFAVGSRLTYAVEEDCRFIINNIILHMNDPFREQTWGFTDGVDIDLSLDEYEWVYQGCYIRVQNGDETQVDSFRPVDVAQQAQRIIETCVVDAKQPLGGYADVGHLTLFRSFYVVVSGTSKPPGAQNIGSSNVLSLPSDMPRTLEGRAYLDPLQESSVSRIVTGRLGHIDAQPVRCFDPSFVRVLQPAVPSECNFIIDEIILRLPNLMREQSFGYTSAEDVDLSIKENGQWIYKRCVVFVRTIDREGRDDFRYIDVAITAKRVIEASVDGTKYARGGTAGVGRIIDNFYVSVGGLSLPSGNGTILVLPSDAPVSSPPDRTSVPASLHA